MNPVLEIQYPDGRKENLTMSRNRMVIGRGSDADIRISDSRISRHHAALEIDNGQVYIVDLGGSNGTWIGKSKLLANVREPFPVDGIVYVGPAQIRRVPASAQQVGGLESNVYQPIQPQRQRGGDYGQQGGGRQGGRQSGGQQEGYARPAPQGSAFVELTQKQIQVGPGERTSTQMVISNQGKVVEHYKVVINGVPASWVTLPSQGLELLPRQEGTLNIEFHPPRNSRTSSGAHPVTILIMNQLGQVMAETNTTIEIRAFDQLTLDVRPDPYQSRMGGTMTLTVENSGNSRTEYRVDVMDQTDSLEIYVEPPTGTLAPQQKRQNDIHIRPRRRIWVGQAKRMPLSVSVSSNLSTAEAMPTYTQLATIPRWLPVVFSLACCVIIPFLALLTWQCCSTEIQGLINPSETPTLTPTASLTPTPTVDEPATVTATYELWLTLDDDQDRLTNGQEQQIGTDPQVKDTDDDGLSDYSETNQDGTDPLNRDSDGDGLLDGEEVTDPCLSPNNPDTDNDGIPDNIDDDRCGGVTPTITPRANFALGGHARDFNDEAVGFMGSAGMSWVKVQVKHNIGADGVSAGRDLNQWNEAGFKILVSVVGNRDEIYNPGYNDSFSRFAVDVVRESGASGIEIWNEPNIQNEWTPGRISPVDYVVIARVTATAVRSIRPEILVVSAGLAPNGVPVNDNSWPDDLYLEGMVAAGILDIVDCVGLHHNQGALPPNESSGDGRGAHYSFYWRGLVDRYLEIINPSGEINQLSTPLCVTEVGYLTDQGFSDTLEQKSPNFAWAADTSVFQQAEWLSDTLKRSCRERHTLLVIVWNVNFTGDLGEDPQAGYAIVRPDGSCFSCEELFAAVRELRGEGCMDF